VTKEKEKTVCLGNSRLLFEQQYSSPPFLGEERAEETEDLWLATGRRKQPLCPVLFVLPGEFYNAYNFWSPRH
jgi:hypothetical protein